MTDQPTTTAPAVVQNDRLIRQALAEVESGKSTFAQVVKAVMATPVAPAEEAKPKPPAPMSISDEHRSALRRLPEVYGKVAPTEARLLDPTEQRDLIEERQVIDSLLTLLKKRKDEGIRETIAYHLDAVIEDSGQGEQFERDAKGHFLVKQDVPVEGTDRKFQRTISDPAPTMPSAAALLEAVERGEISRAQYLALTEVPEVPRVFSETKARKAIAKDPALMMTLARLATPGKRVATIKVEKA